MIVRCTFDSTGKISRMQKEPLYLSMQIPYFDKILFRITSGKYFTEFISTNCAHL